MSQPEKVHQIPAIAGERAILARRYAIALFELAQDRNVVEAVAGDMLVMQQAIDGDAHYHAMASHPRLSSTKVQQVVKAVAEAGKFDDLTTKFLLRLAAHRRMEHLGDIIDAFQADLAKKRNQHVAYITAAQPLTDQQKEKLSAQLAQMVGGTMRLVIKEDSSLLGGLVIKVGSRLIDASVKGKLMLVERQLKTQQEAA